MKKTILFLMLLPLFASAQGFYTVTPSGIRSASDTAITYLILNVDSSAAVTYKKAYDYIQKTMNRPDFALKAKIENEYLRYSVFAPHIIDFKFRRQLFPIDANYTVELFFKDGKIKYNLISVDLKAENGVPVEWIRKGSNWLGWTRQNVYYNPNQIEHPEEKNAIENYFNKEVDDFLRAIKKGDAW